MRKRKDEGKKELGGTRGEEQCGQGGRVAEPTQSILLAESTESIQDRSCLAGLSKDYERPQQESLGRHASPHPATPVDRIHPAVQPERGERQGYI